MNEHNIRSPRVARVPSPVGAKRIVAGSKDGLTDWLLQRITAVVMAVFTLAALFTVLLSATAEGGWQGLFSGNWGRVFAMVAWLSLSYHAWVGVRDIWMDYIKPLSVRLILNVATALWLMACALYCAQLLWK